MERRPLILLVDDEPFNIAVLEQELADLSYETISAADGQEALDQVATAPPDLVLLDVMMPVMDGFAVLSHLKASATTRDIPVVIISALNDIKSVVKGIEQGAEDYLPKPFDPVLLQARIGACLEKKRLRDQEVEYLRQVERLTRAAADVEQSIYDPGALEPVAARADALGNLARVFQRMAHEVHVREQRLKRQLQQVLSDLEERQQAATETVSLYIPLDRRLALAHGEDLPERTTGAGLFVDVSGFSALTEALAVELGLQRGAEELIRLLNRVFATLIDQVHGFRGSVISFAGDAMTCWFDGDDGLRATTCGLAMQAAMSQSDGLEAAAGTTPRLAVKVAVAAGPARRFVVGDPEVQVMDVLAGRPVDDLALAEQLAGNGEVLVEEGLVEAAAGGLIVAGWRSAPVSGRRFAVVSGVTVPVDVSPWAEPPPGGLGDEVTRSWLLSPVYDRVRSGKSEFLAELRPAAALFLGFRGIDFEGDDRAGRKLDEFVRWVQAVVSRYDGSLLQVMIGDKGNYFYATFGAPIAHEDDAVRAVAAALDLQSPPTKLHITGTEIGLAYGQMRAGAYGGPGHRTYSVHGKETNLAAHLMQHAMGGILCDEAIQRAAGSRLTFEPLGAIPSKGVGRPINVFRPVASTMQSVISSRLDRLPPAQQLTLKVASVIGTSFGTRLLREIHPIDADRPDVDAHLHAAEQAGLVARRSGEEEPAYEFSDSLTRDQAYRLLLFSQRRRLHQTVAEWYERTHAEDLTRFYPLLAHHWDAAEDPTKAGAYLELAGLHAQEHGAPGEAARYFRASLSLTVNTTVRSTGTHTGPRDDHSQP